MHTVVAVTETRQRPEESKWGDMAFESIVFRAQHFAHTHTHTTHTQHTHTPSRNIHTEDQSSNQFSVKCLVSMFCYIQCFPVSWVESTVWSRKCLLVRIVVVIVVARWWWGVRIAYGKWRIVFIIFCREGNVARWLIDRYWQECVSIRLKRTIVLWWEKWGKIIWNEGGLVVVMVVVVVVVVVEEGGERMRRRRRRRRRRRTLDSQLLWLSQEMILALDLIWEVFEEQIWQRQQLEARGI